MMSAQPVRVRPIRTRREKRAFLLFPWRVYRGDPSWVPPLVRDRAERIDPSRGPFFLHGEGQCFVAWRDGEPVGTVCAGVDRRRNDFLGIREGIFGLFECIADFSVAEALLEATTDWGRERGLSAMLGPFHFDYEDAYGILIEGYDRPPVILCGHTPPYYREFVERYGCVPARSDNLAYEVQIREIWGSPQTDKLRRAAAIARKRGRVSVRSGRFEEWDQEIERVLPVLNAGLAVLPDATPWALETFVAHATALKPVLDPDLILIGEADGQPVGWLPGVPNFNEALVHANGLRLPTDYARLWWHMRRRPACLCVKSIAVIPEHWGRGVDALMLEEMALRAIQKGYQWLDFSLTEEANPMTPRLAERLGAHIYKRYRVYRKEL